MDMIVSTVKGIGILATLQRGYLAYRGMTPVQRLEAQKAIARAANMPAANDAEFDPSPVVA